MPLFTVLIPTFNHCETIEFAIKSVQNQTIQDFEIIVVGDGQPKRLDTIMNKLTTSDKRIKYFPNSKGEGYGENYRKEALDKVNSSFICYLGDDDLWFPNHLEVMKHYLKKNDFVHTCQTHRQLDGSFLFLQDNLNFFFTRKKMLHSRWNFFGPTCVGHRLDSYRKLPHGWRPKPENLWSDLYMWRQWLEQPWAKFFSIQQVTTLKFPDAPRKNLKIDERLTELKNNWKKIANPAFQKRLNKLRQQNLIAGYQSENWYLNVAKELLKNNSLNLAEEALQKGVLLNKCNSESWYLLSNIEYERDNFIEAREFIEKAIKLDIEKAYYWAFSGEIHLKLRNFESALSDYQKAISLENKPIYHTQVSKILSKIELYQTE